MAITTTSILIVTVVRPFLESRHHPYVTIGGCITLLRRRSKRHALYSALHAIAEKEGQKGETKMGRRGRACVVVLGDLGRSPRMQYQALSLARQVILSHTQIDTIHTCTRVEDLMVVIVLSVFCMFNSFD